MSFSLSASSPQLLCLPPVSSHNSALKSEHKHCPGWVLGSRCGRKTLFLLPSSAKAGKGSWLCPPSPSRSPPGSPSSLQPCQIRSLPFSVAGTGQPAATANSAVHMPHVPSLWDTRGSDHATDTSSARGDTREANSALRGARRMLYPSRVCRAAHSASDSGTFGRGMAGHRMFYVTSLGGHGASSSREPSSSLLSPQMPRWW